VSGPEPAVRVCLDVTAVPTNPAGAGRYTIELAGALGRLADVDLVLVSRRTDQARWEGPNRVVRAAAPGARPLRLVWEQARLPRLLHRLAPDVHHGPHYTMPERAPVPVVVTIHDCTFFDHPEWHERSKAVFFRRAIRTAARRAAALVCVSSTTAEQLGRLCSVRGPVFVAPHGVDLRRFTPDEPSPGADEAALRRLGVDPGRPIVGFVGTIEPRKGVGTLVRAFDRVADRSHDAVLVLAGQQGWGGDEVGRALAVARHPDRVVQTGYVPDETVPALLRRSAVVVYPSLAEGYGLPALEAMACGAPLVTTSGTAMAEMAAGSALLVPPGDAEALADAMRSLIDGEEGAARAERRRLGLQVAATRTWQASARVHLDAYRRAAGGAPAAGR
jgi:glycosyltransferase involved in cell wall biosynthesis